MGISRHMSYLVVHPGMWCRVCQELYSLLFQWVVCGNQPKWLGCNIMKYGNYRHRASTGDRASIIKGASTVMLSVPLVLLGPISFEEVGKWQDVPC